MKHSNLFRWLAAQLLMLAIAVAPSTASAQEADTLTISGGTLTLTGASTIESTGNLILEGSTLDGTTVLQSSGTLTLRFFYFTAAQEAQMERGVKLRCFGEARRGPMGLEIVHPEYKRADAADARRQVEDQVDRPPAARRVGQQSPHGADLAQVILPAARHDDLRRATRPQPLEHMRPEEARPTGDQNARSCGHPSSHCPVHCVAGDHKPGLAMHSAAQGQLNQAAYNGNQKGSRRERSLCSPRIPWPISPHLQSTGP